MGLSGGAMTSILPLPPTPPTISEHSPLDSREQQGQGQGLGSRTMPPHGVTGDDEVTVVQDTDAASTSASAINGSNGEKNGGDPPEASTSMEDRCACLHVHLYITHHQPNLLTHTISPPHQHTILA